MNSFACLDFGWQLAIAHALNLLDQLIVLVEKLTKSNYINYSLMNMFNKVN